MPVEETRNQAKGEGLRSRLAQRCRCHRRLLIAGAFMLSVFLFAIGRFHFWAEGHTLKMTGDPRWSSNCVACHLSADRWAQGVASKAIYQTPLNLAVSPEGRAVLVCASESDSLLVVDPNAGTVTARIQTGRRPHSVCVSRDGTRAFVSNRWSHDISVIDLKKRKEVARWPAGQEPTGLTLDAAEKTLYVANSCDGTVSVINVDSGKELKRLAAGREPWDVSLGQAGKSLFVTNRLAELAPLHEPMRSELTEIDLERKVVRRRYFFPSAHLMEGVAIGRDLALVSLVQAKNLLPATAVQGGWMMTHGLGAVLLDRSGTPSRVIQIPLDTVNRSFADPSDIVLGPDGHTAYVSHSGADVISVIDLDRLQKVIRDLTPRQRSQFGNDLSASHFYVKARIPTGACPKGLAVSPNGEFLYVADSLDDQLEVIDTRVNKVVRSVALAEAGKQTLARQGARIFFNASHSFQGRFSCRSCHPDGHGDGLAYDFEPDGLGRNYVDNRSLRDLRGTTPFKWNGVSPSLFKQCGPRFAMFVSRAQPLEPKQLLRLVAFIRSVPYPPPPRCKAGPGLTEEQARGKAIFFRTMDNSGRPIPLKDRCSFCHSGPKFTDRLAHDVGTAAPTDSVQKFDTPGLGGVAASPPYLHDGRALSLEEIWTRFGLDDRHGIASDMTKQQLNDLVAYMEGL